MISRTLEQTQKRVIGSFLKWHDVSFQKEVLCFGGSGRADFVLKTKGLNRVKEIAVEVKSPQSTQELYTAIGQAVCYLADFEESWIAVSSGHCARILPFTKKYEMPIRLFDSSTMLDFETQTCPFCLSEVCQVCRIKPADPIAKVFFLTKRMRGPRTDNRLSPINRVPWIN